MPDKLNHFIPKKEYFKIATLMPINCVDVLLFNADCTKTLLFYRQNEPARHQWYTLGGRQRKNEPLMNVARRQLLTEVGLRLPKSRLVFSGVQDEIFKQPAQTRGRHYICVYYACVVDAPRIRLDAQHSESRWFSVRSPKLHPYVRTKVQACLRSLKKR